ncbi:MAG: CPBP family intramembrane glutamic endopeptidase [Deltaproteobacteria bacterium]
MPTDASPRPPVRPARARPAPVVVTVPGSSWGRAKHYFTHRVDPLTSVFLVIPLYLVYQLGVLLQMRCDASGCTWVRNGVDFVTGNVLEATHGSRLAVAGLALFVGAGLAAGVLWSRRRAKLHPKLFIPVLLESAIYAALAGPTLVATQHAMGLGAPGSSSFLSDVVASFGAGLHEELIFRVVLFAGGAFALKKVGVKAWQAVLVAALASSLVFSAVHHLGALGEPFTVRAFVFRTLAGLLFATIYSTRGFAIAAWTHALYDVSVFGTERLLGH